jgi:hypothetical protein
MAIKSRREMPRGIEIDLGGPQGNAFYLLGLARKLAQQMDKDADAIAAEMKQSDYEHLLRVFDREFGAVVTLYRADDLEADDYEDEEES